MEALQAKLLEKADSISKLGKVLSSMDRDKDNVLSLKELKDGVAALDLSLRDEEVEGVFSELDKDKSGTLNLQEFFVAVRGCLSPKKLEVLMAVFRKLDKDGSGVVNIDDLKNGFDFKYATGTNADRAKELMEMFDSNEDGKVTKDEFLNEHTGLSRLADGEFTEFMTSAWSLSEQDLEGAADLPKQDESSPPVDVRQAIITQVFNKLDKDGSGEIAKNDLKDGFDATFAENSSNEEAARHLMGLFDADKDGKITLEEFRSFFSKGQSSMPEEEFVRMMKGVWKLSE